jgi:tetratricopeptide (TPR) repeat protein
MADRPSPPRPARTAPGPRIVESKASVLPFLGRERELAALNAYFDRTIAGEGRMVLVSGEVGIGKTRLVETFLDVAARRSLQPLLILQGRCYAAESSAPYAMWADALQVFATDRGRPYLADLPQVWRMQLARLVPDLGVPARDMQGATAAESRLRLLQGVARTLAHAAGAGVLCLWFDDLHWADEASLAALHYVARHLVDQPVLIIGTSHPDAPDDAASLQALLAGIPHAATLTLSPLAPEAVDAMLRRLGYPDDTELARRLYRHSEGNPLFLTETVQTLIESGELDAGRAGRAVPADVETWPVPARIQRVIQDRTASLPDTARRVLAAGAVIGRPFGPVLVRRVSGMPEPDVIEAVDRALRRGFLDERSGHGPEASLGFHHSYIRRVIEGGLSAIQRQALHRRAGEALLALNQARPQAVIEEVAHHFEQAGDPRAVTYLVEAAEQAGALYAYGNATAYLTRALARLDPTQPEDRERRFDLLLERETLLDRQGRRAEQAQDVAALKELAEDLDDPARLARALVREAGLLSTTGDYDGARQAGKRALARYRTADDGAGEGQALRELGFTAWSAGDYGAALGYMRDALTLHRRLGNVEGEATAMHNLAEIHRSLGSPRQALGEYETALNLYWARQMRKRQALTLYGMANALREMDEREKALRRYRETLDHCEAVGDRLMASRVHHALANLHRDLAHPDAALDHMAQAVAISREIGYGPGIAHGLVTLSALEAQNGRPEAAAAHLAEARTWLSLTEAEDGAPRAGTEGAATFPQNAAAPDLPIRLGWVKSHVTLPEGKVYCAFESPVARDVLVPPRLSDDPAHSERPDAAP